MGNRVDGPSREEVRNWLGLSRRSIVLTSCALVVSLIGNLAQGIERWITAVRHKSDVYVVAVDRAGNVLGTGEGVDAWTPSDEVWNTQALTWLVAARGRSNDETRREEQNQYLNCHSTRDLWGTVSDWLKEQRKKIGNASVEVKVDEVFRTDPDRLKDTATVRIRWKERVMTAGSRPPDWNVKVANIFLGRATTPPLPQCAVLNLLKLYVTYYQPLDVES